MTFYTIKTDIEDGIYTITINRPDKMNALSKMVFDELDKAMDIVYADKDVQGVIITGEGRKAFVAGADITEFLDIQQGNSCNLAVRGQQVFFKIENSPKPVVAAVNGFALGGGCELAMACHMRLASQNAKFGQPEVNLGLIPGYGGTQRLQALVGRAKAMELILTGNMVDAQEAKALGLINQVYSQEDLLEKTKELLKLILSKSPVAVAKAIEAINSFDHSKAGFEREAQLFAEAFSSDDMKEGTAAFLEKRKPKFRK